MDYAVGLQKALDYIELHLDDDLDVSEIAKQAACSQFYFQRIFGLLCGMTLGEYIRNRRLAIAGSRLQQTNTKVIDVALKCGYNSPESFTRAFYKFHGITPSQAKNGGCVLRSFSPFSVKLTIKGGIVMNYKIIEKEAFYILEKTSKHSLREGENKTSVPAFWTQCHKDGTINQLICNTSDDEYIYGICYGQKNGSETFDYSVAALCDENTPVPDGFKKTLIPARTWAVFECVGTMPKAIQETWQTIVSEFFPTSDYRPTYEMDIEAYPDGDMDSGDYKCEIWVTVQKS